MIRKPLSTSPLTSKLTLCLSKLRIRPQGTCSSLMHLVLGTLMHDLMPFQLVQPMERLAASLVTARMLAFLAMNFAML